MMMPSIRVQTVTGSAVPSSSTRALTGDGAVHKHSWRSVLAPPRRSPTSSNGTDTRSRSVTIPTRHTLEHFVKTLGFVPNSLLTMQRVPGDSEWRWSQHDRAVFDPEPAGRPGPQTTRRPHGELCRGLPVLPGAHHGQCHPPRGRRREDGGDLRVRVEPAVRRPRAGRARFRLAEAAVRSPSRAISTGPSPST